MKKKSNLLKAKKSTPKKPALKAVKPSSKGLVTSEKSSDSQLDKPKKKIVTSVKFGPLGKNKKEHLSSKELKINQSSRAAGPTRESNMQVSPTKSQRTTPKNKSSAGVSHVSAPDSLMKLDAVSTSIDVSEKNKIAKSHRGNKKSNSSHPPHHAPKSSSDSSFESEMSQELWSEVLDEDTAIKCLHRECQAQPVVDGYCRYHYLASWKKLQLRRKILADGKFFKYVEDLTGKYPDKFLEIIQKDLSSDRSFQQTIYELNIDESPTEQETDHEEDSRALDEVKVFQEPAYDDDGF